MKRIVILLAVILTLIANLAEARSPRRGNSYNTNYSYTQPTNYVQTAPLTQPAPVLTKVTALKPVLTDAPTTTTPTMTAATNVSAIRSTDYSTATAQGVANIMAARGVVGHFGGNPGYEGCGMASTPEAAYSMCCYANSGMATVDVGYAQGANGMWYCCRRYQ